ncbi:MAG: ATP-dependent zinc metalloprotease FtsH [Spirochaetales bacterium]|nr:ATP-dependent zinc metalloprotease FtsH [Spirochaetales bacterium]
MAKKKEDEKKKEEEGCWEKGTCKDPDLFGPLFRMPNKGQFKFSLWYFLITLFVLLLINSLFVPAPESLVGFSDFKKKIEQGEIVKVQMGENFYYGFTESTGERGSGVKVYRTVPINDPTFIQLMDAKGVSYMKISEKGNAFINFLLTWVVPFFFFFFIWRLMFQRMGNMGSNVLALGRNRAAIVAEGTTGVSFNDVAGCDEAKEELMEVVDFLKNPGKYTRIGGKIPKGVLLVGPPGTGKTLLAKAVAGEAGVPFFRISGSDFVEMFVGVGAARVRDLFRQAREKAPCIIFIDELDAIGKSRVNVLGGNEEREQTLNQLLVEMDGFDSRTGVIILAATNRPEILDPALLRAGRFDRQILVDRPDLAGREAILRIHAKGVKLAPDVDLHKVARDTPGFVGSDLANLVNEAALLAVRNGRSEVTQADFSEAIEKVIAGLQKKNRLISPDQKRIVAYHEAGHALVAAFTEGADPVRKITIVPRGIGALGYTLQIPTEDKFLMTEKELYSRIDTLLGGRAAEELVFGTVSTGAANDLVKVSDIAKRMVTEYGMSPKFRNVALNQRQPALLGPTAEAPQMYRDYSDATQSYIDETIASIVNERYAQVKKLLEEKRPLLEKLASRLLESETIEEHEFAQLIKESA